MQQNWGTLFSINCRRRKSPKFGLKERRLLFRRRRRFLSRERERERERKKERQRERERERERERWRKTK
jgi:hypothetical protein